MSVDNNNNRRVPRYLRQRQDVVTDATNGALDTEGAAGIAEMGAGLLPGVGNLAAGGMRFIGAEAHADKAAENWDDLAAETGYSTSSLRLHSRVIREEMGEIDSHVRNALIGYSGYAMGGIVGYGLGGFVPLPGASFVGGIAGGYVGGLMTGDGAQVDNNVRTMLIEIRTLQVNGEEVPANKAFLLGVATLPPEERARMYQMIYDATDGGRMNPQAAELVIDRIRRAEEYRLNNKAMAILGAAYDPTRSSSEQLAAMMSHPLAQSGKPLHPIAMLLDEPSVLPQVQQAQADALHAQDEYYNMMAADVPPAASVRPASTPAGHPPRRGRTTANDRSTSA